MSQPVNHAVSVMAQAQNGLQQYDKDHQQQIVNDAIKAGDPASAEPKLQAWRAQRSGIVKAIQGVWDAIAVAATALPLVEHGVKKNADLSTWISTIYKNLEALKTALSDAGVPLGPVGAL